MNPNAVKPEDLEKVRSFLRKKDVEFAFVGGAAWMESIGNVSNSLCIASDVDILLVKGDIKAIEEAFSESSERHGLVMSIKLLSHDMNVKTAPFEAFSFKEAGIDVFTMDTGIGPIPINEESLVKKGNGYALKPSALIATFVNPLAITDERIKKAATLIFSLKNEEIEKVAYESHALVLKSAERVKDAIVRDEKLRKDPNFKDYLEVYIGKTPKRIEILSRKLVRIANALGLKDAEGNEEKLKRYIRTFDSIKTEAKDKLPSYN